MKPDNEYYVEHDGVVVRATGRVSDPLSDRGWLRDITAMTGRREFNSTTTLNFRATINVLNEIWRKGWQE